MTWMARTVPGGTAIFCPCGYNIKEATLKEAIAEYEANHKCDYTEGNP